MKKIVLLLALFAVISSCDKNDDKNCSGIDCLPPATQNGADTFGCLVNGMPFIDKSRSFNCFYQLVDGEYYFNISANFGDKVPKVISLATNGLEINLNSSYELLNRDPGNFYAEVTFDNAPPTFLNDNTTNSSAPGAIIINKLDFEDNIISGTFSFQVKDTINNKIYKITEGRFDTHFSE